MTTVDVHCWSVELFSIRSNPRLYKRKIQRERYTEKTVQKQRNFHGLKRYEAMNDKGTTDWETGSVF
jgi:hypothetical protein